MVRVCEENLVQLGVIKKDKKELQAKWMRLCQKEEWCQWSEHRDSAES